MPAPVAVTLPFWSTVAAAVFELDHSIVLLSAFDGDTVAVSVFVCPLFRLIDVEESLIDDTLIPVTVTAQLACAPEPSFAFA